MASSQHRNKQQLKQPPILQKKRNKQAGKFYKPQGGAWNTYEKDLKSIQIEDAAVDVHGNIVCPCCGTYNARNVDYGYSSEKNAHKGKLQFTCVCTVCNTCFTYFRSVF